MCEKAAEIYTYDKWPRYHDVFVRRPVEYENLDNEG